jgi:hypothetical protein
MRRKPRSRRSWKRLIGSRRNVSQKKKRIERRRKRKDSSKRNRSKTLA